MRHAGSLAVPLSAGCQAGNFERYCGLPTGHETTCVSDGICDDECSVICVLVVCKLEHLTRRNPFVRTNLRNYIGRF